MRGLILPFTMANAAGGGGWFFVFVTSQGFVFVSVFLESFKTHGKVELLFLEGMARGCEETWRYENRPSVGGGPEVGGK